MSATVDYDFLDKDAVKEQINAELEARFGDSLLMVSGDVMRAASENDLFGLCYLTKSLEAISEAARRNYEMLKARHMGQNG